MTELVDREIECGLIGALLYYPGVFAKVQPVVRQSHFAEAFLGDVYRWIGQRHEEGAVAGEALQLACLEECSHLDKGPETIAHCIAATFVPIEVPGAIKQLVWLAERRRMIEVAGQITHEAEQGLSDTLVADAIDRIVIDDTGGEAFTKPAVPLSEAMAGINAAIQRVPTGSAGLDRKIAGWQAGRFYVIGGRPGSGKTTLGLSLMLQSAKHGAGVAFFSLEMSAAELAARALADLAYSRNNFVPYTDIERGKVEAHLQYRIDAAKDELAGLPVTINDRAAPTLGELRVAIRSMQNSQRIDVVLIDHLGLIKPSGDYRGNKVAETGQVSAGLKALAKDLDVAVIAVCQLNREAEHRDNKKPTLADLRWAGEIEQDADVVLMVYRPAYYLEPGEDAWFDEKNKLQALIRKNRSGETGTVKMFVEMAAAHVRDEWR